MYAKKGLDEKRWHAGIWASPWHMICFSNFMVPLGAGQGSTHAEEISPGVVH